MNKHHVKLIISISAFLSGFLFFLFFHNIITISVKTSRHYAEQPQHVHEKIPVFYTTTAHKQELRSITSSSLPQERITHIAQAWCSVLNEEVTHKSCVIERCALSKQQELFISFDRSPFPKQWSLRKKIKLLESLMHTLTASTDITGYRLFMQTKPFFDHHIDTSRSFHPTLFQRTEPKKTIPSQQLSLKSIIIEPAVYAQEPGRSIEDTNERVIALKTAHQLKTLIEQLAPHIHVTVLRTEHLSMEDRCTLINIKQPSFFLRLGAYEEPDELPHCDWYGHELHEPHAYPPCKEQNFIPLQYASLSTQATRDALMSSVIKNVQQSACVTTYTTFPLKYLAGISAPALYLELGINSKHALKKLVEIIAQAIVQ